MILLTYKGPITSAQIGPPFEWDIIMKNCTDGQITNTCEKRLAGV